MTDNSGDSPWWSPKSIREQEQHIRRLADQGKLDTRNDFASYRALADGADPISAGLHHHNPYTETHIRALCRDYKNILQHLTFSPPQRIVDLGCGAGFTTGGLKQLWPHAHVEGIDVSHDAVRFASAKWTNCSFTARAIDPTEPLSTEQYDLILCQEFYPFTRTSSLREHQKWITYVTSQLTQRGAALITVTASNQESITANIKALKQSFALKQIDVAVPRFSQHVPLVLSRAAGTAAKKFKPEWVRSVYVVSKSR
jgi:SAM-dependent methyltransferase